MKKFICKKDYYVEDVKFASTGDNLVLLPDNRTVVNLTGRQRSIYMPTIVNNFEHFTPVEEEDTPKEDKVNHPSHYTWLKEKCGIEVIDITRHMDFCLGNAIKYLLRAGHKVEKGYIDNQKEIEDLKKAIWYIEDRVKQLENNK